ncbi:MAG: wax ester/triacylglycerol synthase family O-acyltransferase [Proteobacteria bacterium]|nr:wax ester/triacylglycerol synthase family O-acyltransferase [Pseudomonadota bacterium]
MTTEDKVQRLNGNDEYFLDTDTPAAPTHIGGLEIYKLPPGAGRDFLQKYYNQLKRMPVRAEPFNYVLSSLDAEQEDKPEEGPLAWLRPTPRRKKKEPPARVWRKLDNVNPEEHIYLHRLPYPGGQRELGELVARLHVDRLDRTRPLWEYHLIEGLEGGRYATYTKLHHSQFDGKRGMALAQYTRSTKATARNLPAVWSVDLDKVRGRSASAKAAAAADEPGTFQKLAAFGKALSKMGEARQNQPGEGVIGPYTAPESILNGPLTPRRRLGTVSLPIPRIKKLGAAVEGGATVNEILLAVIGGALRRYLLDRDSLPKDPLIAACPVALVRKDEAAAGNAIAQILVSLGTNIADPKQRLQAVVESSHANKGLMKELEGDAYYSYVMLSMMPQGLAAKTKYGHKVLNANLIISNVPGPRETQYVNGARMEAMYAAPLLLPGQALNITASNFGDNLDIGIMSCPDLCTSPQRIAVYIGQELEILERAMGLARARGAKKAAPKGRPAKEAAAKKAPAKKAAAKKAAAKKAPAAKKAGAAKKAAVAQKAGTAGKTVVAKKAGAAQEAAAPTGASAAKKAAAKAKTAVKKGAPAGKGAKATPTTAAPAKRARRLPVPQPAPSAASAEVPAPTAPVSAAAPAAPAASAVKTAPKPAAKKAPARKAAPPVAPGAGATPEARTQQPSVAKRARRSPVAEHVEVPVVSPAQAPGTMPPPDAAAGPTPPALDQSS